MSEVIVGVSTDTGGGLDPIPANTLLGNLTGSSALPTGQDAAAVRDWLFAIIYAQTTDPGIAGQPWNDNGTIKFSTGYSPSLDFSNSKNSMYLGTLA
jgi:hypothetical protein